MKKLLKIIVLSLLGLFTIFIIGSIVSLYIPDYDTKDLKSIVYRKTGFTIRNDFEIVKYENTGIAISDFVEIYHLKLSNKDYEHLYNAVETKKILGWEKVEKGYTKNILLDPKNRNYLNIADFYLDNEKRVFEVTIGHE